MSINEIGENPSQPGYSKPLSSSEEMVQELYSELRNLAAAKMSRLPPGQTLQATALLHEAYLRLSREPNLRWDNKGHFFAAAAEAMRRILVDRARRNGALRRGGNHHHVSLDDVEVQALDPDERLLEVESVLDEFEAQCPLQAQIVKLRFFAGLKHQEIASLLEVSEKTVRRHWTFAKIWLYQRLSRKDPSSE